ncbi:phosphate/phosphite/phosphonate ABC transporter substrate-binding protein [Paenibacillus glucanolyticus]|uniref:phosphate/phosphite/phosphonate ABC transporter substrate-binding protein n=1 Tax=Paenibacillus glucanolyticus TaxID=59843 RepID=UPI0012DBA394|nr:phosphate/phosphite/phosphonate ABC transporter substrate-binding protein [Paenibacillus glucanolyticus]MPY18319.1 phosphate/phosphite/phosphonate ABC transporter substrate-binding protein [Paenibacillus glucanolyticus]
MKKLLSIILALVIVTIFAGCSSNSAGSDTLTIAWLPNESGADLGEARDEIGKVIEEATGKQVKHQTTTDYIIAIEAIANGNADLAFFGPQGYIEAHDKNEKVLPLVVPSGSSGTLDDAVYYSWLAVKKGNEDEYKDGDGFKIDPIAGKKMSFVSTSSTSGFKVPSSGIVGYFSKMDPYKELKADDLLEGGNGKFFSEVLYGNSHQGSAVNLLNGKADVAAFCDSCVNNYVERVDGEENRAGAVYKVKDDAEEPFNAFKGEEFELISVTPVLNSPFVVNTDNVDQATVDKLLAALTSDEVTNNPKVFVPKDSGFSGIFAKSGDEKLLPVDDAWFNPIRELSN